MGTPPGSDSRGVALIRSTLKRPAARGRLWTSTVLANRSRAAAFLAYHSISEPGPRFLSLPPETFERQLATLRRRGYVSGGCASLRDLLDGRRPHRPHAFVTFDDGYRDNHDTALPLLDAYGFSALVFVLPPYLDQAAPFDWPEVADARRDHPQVMRSMSWAMVEQLAARGWNVGSHTCSHPHLPELGDEALNEELWSSRARVRDRLGSCDALAYPFGDWNGRVAAAAAAAGYKYAFSLPRGAQRTGTPLSIPRVHVDRRDDGRRFAAKLSPLSRRAFLSEAKVTARSLRARLRLDGASRRTGPPRT